MNRREFLERTVAGGAAVAFGASLSPSLEAAGVRWPVGCFNRPWTTWSFDETLKQIKAAGYQATGLLTRTKDEPFIGTDAIPEYLAALEKRIAASGLTANMAALRSRHHIPLDESIKEVRKQIDNAASLKLSFVLSFGVDKPEEYDHFNRVMSDTATYAQEKKIKLVMKPHGGSSGASGEIVMAMKAVRHPNLESIDLTSGRSMRTSTARAPRCGRCSRRWWRPCVISDACTCTRRRRESSSRPAADSSRSRRAERIRAATSGSSGRGRIRSCTSPTVLLAASPSRQNARSRCLVRPYPLRQLRPNSAL